MRYGIYDLRRVSIDEEMVRCNNCGHYFYDDIIDERHNNSLQILYDIDDNEIVKGCPICKTDGYLIDIDLSVSNQEEINRVC